MIISSISEYIVPIVDVIPTPDSEGIQAATYLGTGFFISNKWLMTCRHVINKAKNFPCVVYKVVGNPDNSRIDGLKNIKLHPYADIAVAEVSDIASKFYKPLSTNFASELILGQDIINYSYVENPQPDYKVGLTPRVLKGYITRTSVEQNDPRLSYLEVSFPALSGMSGSPILDNEANVIGIIYRNYRSQILEDYVEEHRIEYEKNTLKETHISYKVVDYGQAVDLAKYKDFIVPLLTEQ